MFMRHVILWTSMVLPLAAGCVAASVGVVLGVVVAFAAVVPLLEPVPGIETFAGGISLGVADGAEPAEPAAAGLEAAGALVDPVAGV